MGCTHVLSAWHTWGTTSVRPDCKSPPLPSRNAGMGHSCDCIRPSQIVEAPSSMSDMAAGEKLLREHIFVHLQTGTDKFALLIVMLRKLFALARALNRADTTASSLL